MVFSLATINLIFFRSTDPRHFHFEVKKSKSKDFNLKTRVTCSFLDCLCDFIFTQNWVIPPPAHYLNSQQLALPVVNYAGPHN